MSQVRINTPKYDALAYEQNEGRWAITLSVKDRSRFFTVNKEDMPELTEATLRAFVAGVFAGLDRAKRQLEGFASLITV